MGCRIQDPGTHGYRWWKQPTFRTARAQRTVRSPTSTTTSATPATELMRHSLSVVCKRVQGGCTCCTAPHDMTRGFGDVEYQVRRSKTVCNAQQKSKSLNHWLPFNTRVDSIHSVWILANTFAMKYNFREGYRWSHNNSGPALTINLTTPSNNQHEISVGLKKTGSYSNPWVSVRYSPGSN